MKYVERVLQPGERVIYITSLHWLIYSRAIVLLVLAAGCLIGSVFVPADWVNLILALRAAGALLALLALIHWASALIRRTSTELAITDRRVIYKSGILRRHTIEINRSKVETVGVDQSILGRIMGYGTVVVRGTGGSFEPIPMIGEPLTFRSHITAG
ncbi:MAG TPA: PH domain-containing protein [Stellaceae bacterium]|nr:PH domain-containing protein [Stellaceae bacterium]